MGFEQLPTKIHLSSDTLLSSRRYRQKIGRGLAEVARRDDVLNWIIDTLYDFLDRGDFLDSSENVVVVPDLGEVFGDTDAFRVFLRRQIKCAEKKPSRRPRRVSLERLRYIDAALRISGYLE